MWLMCEVHGSELLPVAHRAFSELSQELPEIKPNSLL